MIKFLAAKYFTTKSRTAKSFAALAILAVLGASVMVLPGFTPDVKAGETVVLAKADRLPVGPVVQNCLGQVWPNFDSSCLRDDRDDRSVAMIREVSLTTARR